MAITIRGIDHVVLRVSDLARAVRFYCDVLGCVEERRVQHLGLVQLRAGRSLVDLIERGSGVGPGASRSPDSDGGNMDHFCLRVEPFDEVGLRVHLAAHGIQAGETATRYGAEGTGPSIYIDDPDGNTVELKGPAQGLD